MKFLELRKFLFANISAFWCYILVFFVINYAKTNYPPPNHNDVLALGAVDFALILISLLILMCFIVITIFEILARKYIIEKKFPNFKLNIKINIPRVFIIIYNIIFLIGISIAFIIFLTLLVITLINLISHLPFLL